MQSASESSKKLLELVKELNNCNDQIQQLTKERSQVHEKWRVLADDLTKAISRLDIFKW